jgi:hypothetical protein
MKLNTLLPESIAPTSLGRAQGDPDQKMRACKYNKKLFNTDKKDKCFSNLIHLATFNDHIKHYNGLVATTWHHHEYHPGL